MLVTSLIRSNAPRCRFCFCRPFIVGANCGLTPSLTPSVTTSPSASASRSPSPSIAASVTTSASVSPTASPSRSVTPSPTASASPAFAPRSATDLSVLTIQYPMTLAGTPQTSGPNYGSADALEVVTLDNIAGIVRGRLRWNATLPSSLGNRACTLPLTDLNLATNIQLTSSVDQAYLLLPCFDIAVNRRRVEDETFARDRLIARIDGFMGGVEVETVLAIGTRYVRNVASPDGFRLYAAEYRPTNGALHAFLYGDVYTGGGAVFNAGQSYMHSVTIQANTLYVPWHSSGSLSSALRIYQVGSAGFLPAPNTDAPFGVVCGWSINVLSSIVQPLLDHTRSVWLLVSSPSTISQSHCSGELLPGRCRRAL